MRSVHKLFSLLLLLICSISQAKPSFVMAFARDPASDPQYSFYLQLYSEAFAELGYEFEYQLYPSMRATYLADLGQVDGEPQRIYTYTERSPNQIRVEEAVFTNRTLAFSTNANLNLDGLTSLKNTNLRVDYLRGSVWSKNQLEPLVKAENLQIVDNTEQGLLKLINQRSDVFVALEATVLKVLQADNHYQQHKIFIAGELGNNLSYPYVHKQHAELAILLAAQLQTMKANGRYQQLLAQHMPFMLNQ